MKENMKGRGSLGGARSRSKARWTWAFFILLATLSLSMTAYNIIAATKAAQNPEPILAKHRIKPFHTIITSDGSSYQLWQSRIMYYWYKKNRGPEMGGFTRILHSGQPDDYMEEIPTFVSQPLSDKEYVVMHRPFGVLQWLEEAEIEEDYIFMSEPDHLIVRPIPNMATKYYGVAYPFNYIVPYTHKKLLIKHFPNGRFPMTRVDSIGNCPAIVSKEALMRITPHWLNMSLSMKNDPETYKELGWILEMYAYAMASAFTGVLYKLKRDFEVQAPLDTKLADTYIVHYTYSLEYDLQGKRVSEKEGNWSFNKRRYHVGPPKNLALPPVGTPETVVKMLSMINEASANLQGWKSD